MVISSYHIKNVLRVYGEQLKNGKRNPVRVRKESSSTPDRINISSEGRKRYLTEKMVSDLIERISEYGPEGNLEKKVLKKLENEFGALVKITKKDSNELTFKVIDQNGETVRTLSGNDKEFLWQKLEKIAKETINENIS
jgi:hypothetical protein